MARKIIFILSLICLLASCAPTNENVSIKEVEKGFHDVPQDVKICTYWYWISDNISKEGVVKDLKAMKEAGITRAFIGNIGTPEVPYGNVKFMSDEWWEVTRTALKTASELGIEIGMFNSPGWSQSGGPWVSEDESMRYVAFKEDALNGEGGRTAIALPDVPASRIVSVYAYPSIRGSRVTGSRKGRGSTEFKLSSPITVRTLIVHSDTCTKADIVLRCAQDTVKSFYFNRRNYDLNVGFWPDAPVVLSIPEVEGTEFTVDIKPTNDNAVITTTLTDIPLMERYPEKSLAKMYQYPQPMWDEYMWETQPQSSGSKIPRERMINLSENISENGDSIIWNAPAGNWTVVTAYLKTTGVTNAPAVPEATGLEVDKMSRKHIRSHFDGFLGEILKRIPAEERTCLKVAVQDSYETGSTNWTDDMTEVFKKTYGYDPLPYLPVLQGYIVDNEEVSERFLWDLRRLVSDRVAYDYVGGLRDVCHENGMTTWLENYGHWGFPGEFLKYGGQSDEVAGEFWAVGELGDIENRDAASCAHIYGKKKVWAESCTSGDLPFQRQPLHLKKRTDNFFTVGINSTLLHLYIQQPDDRQPGINAWFGTEFNRNNTWFKFFDLFTSYLKRCNYLLQQGSYVADAAYFIGEDAPKMTGECNPGLPKGYSFDFINAEVLQKHSKVKDGCLVLDSGMSYRVLVLPNQTTMRPELLKCISNLVKAGLTVVGPAPEKSPSLQDWPDADARVKSMAAALWENGDCGKGRIFSGVDSLQPVFDAIGHCPDFTYTGSDADIRFIHRSLADAEVYFISNQEDHPVEFNASFRANPYAGAEIWDAVDESRNGLETVKSDAGFTAGIKLDSYGSAFVVFCNEPAPARQWVESGSMEITGPWTVAFDESCGNDSFTMEFPVLEDWSKSADKRLRYFSGTAHYSGKFVMDSVAADGKYVLNLGKVMVIAKVKINGEYAGGVWTNPFSLDISSLIKEGENTIEVDIANNWVNRLIGDATLPERERRTWTYVNPAQNPATELQPSGLIGPVSISKNFVHLRP